MKKKQYCDEEYNAFAMVILLYEKIYRNKTFTFLRHYTLFYGKTFLALNITDTHINKKYVLHNGRTRNDTTQRSKREKKKQK